MEVADRLVGARCREAPANESAERAGPLGNTWREGLQSAPLATPRINGTVPTNKPGLATPAELATKTAPERIAVESKGWFATPLRFQNGPLQEKSKSDIELEVPNP